MAKRRTGAALPVAQVVSIPVANTWGTSDLANAIMNLKTLTLTVGAVTTTTGIASAIAAMWNGIAALGTESRNELGSNVPEFNEITALASSSNVLLTHDTKGTPFTVTASETTAGTGTFGAPSTTTSANGPNHWKTAANYDDNAAPANADELYIDNTDIPILYDMSDAAVTLASLIIGASVGANFGIGLPKTNLNNYPEYRGDYLQVGITLLEISGGNRVKLDWGSVQCTATIFNTGFSQEFGIPAVLLKGTHAANSLEVQNGSVGFAFHGGELGTLADLLVSGGSVYIGDGATLSTCGVALGGGSLRIGSNVLDILQTGGTLTIDKEATVGTLTIRGGQQGATCNYNSSGTCTEATIEGALLDLSGDTTPVIFTDLTLGVGGSYFDPHGRLTVTNGVTYNEDVSRVGAT